MIGTFIIFLVLLVPGTEKPTLVLMHHFDTVEECHKILDKAPPEVKDKFACIAIDLKASQQGVKI